MRPVLSLFSVVVFACTVLPAHAANTSLHEILQQRYAALKTAMAARDVKSLAPLLAQDFRGVEITGKVQGKTQLLAEFAALPAKAPGSESQTTLTSVTRHGDTAKVSQRYTNTSHRGQPPHTVELIALSTDTWTLVHGTWVLSTTHTNELDYLVDGKVVVHKMVKPG